MDTSQLKNVVRKGRISVVDGSSCRAKVVFEDQDQLISDWLPILQPFTSASQAYSVPEIGTPIACIFTMNPSGSGLAAGFILGAYYDESCMPAESDPDVRSVRFPDGSCIRYDHGDITIQAVGNIVIKGAKVAIN